MPPKANARAGKPDPSAGHADPIHIKQISAVRVTPRRPYRGVDSQDYHGHRRLE
jgi:hypothetical protein